VKTNSEERVLSALLNCRGAFVPAATITTLLKISPAELNQHIEGLRLQGATIIVSEDDRCCLQDAPDRLYPVLIQDGLHTVTVARELHYFSRLDSTNRLAKELAEKNAANGTLVLAEEQTAGRGRLDRTWLAPAFSSILCSVIFYPDLAPGSLFRLTMMASVAVASAINRACNLPAKIKWPNDVYIGNKKVCGILTEFSGNKDRIRYAVVGMGLNVNLDFTNHTELAGIATSLQAESGRKISRLKILKGLLEELDYQYQLLAAGRADEVRRAWEQHALILGKRVTVYSGDETITGTAQGIDADGHLLLIDEGGACREIISGDVSLRLE
jgi:BirA family biotin operon repressor/biotin-[acetyl-CoA-carboxylase] ligase